MNTGHIVLTDKLFPGKTQSDKFLDSEWTRVVFMHFEVRKEREKKITF